MLRKYILPRFIFIFYRLWSATWRLQLVEPPEMLHLKKNKLPFVLAFWHGDELVMVSIAGKYNAATMTSTSKDGELMDYVIRKMGMKTSRGSSTRGAVQALKGLIRLSKEGCNPSIAVDGPKGPYHVVKPGVFELSRLAKAPIFTAGVACKSAIRFEKSWNKTYLPKPFAKITLVWKAGFGAVTPDHDCHSPELAQRLVSLFDAAGQDARNLFDAKPL